MFAVLGTVVRFGAALLLLYAGAQKLAAPRPFRQTLKTLRVPVPHLVAVVVAAAEIAAALGLVALPHNALTAMLVVGLGLSFAGAALVAMYRGERIRCACYGPAGEANLGFRQLLALPAWLGVAVVSLLTPDDGISGVHYVSVLALTLAVIVVAYQLLPVGLKNRSYLKLLETR